MFSHDVHCKKQIVLTETNQKQCQSLLSTENLIRGSSGTF